jgi:hypothetical protein
VIELRISERASPGRSCFVQSASCCRQMPFAFDFEGSATIGANATPETRIVARRNYNTCCG